MPRRHPRIVPSLLLLLPLLGGRGAAAQPPAGAGQSRDRGGGYPARDVIDVEAGRAIAGQTVVIREGRIVTVAPDGAAGQPADAESNSSRRHRPLPHPRPV